MSLTSVHRLPIQPSVWQMLLKRLRAAPGRPPVPFIRQEQDNWCWAACCEMIMRGFGLSVVRQCEMASVRAGEACCIDPASQACDQGAWPDEEYPKHGLALDWVDSSIAAIDVDRELRGGRPVEVYYAWSGGGAHVALIVEALGGDRYQVHDPWYGPGSRSYNEIVTGYGMGSWDMSYINIRHGNG